MSAIIANRGKTADLIFSEELELIAPEFLWEEIGRHKNEILRKSELSEAGFDTILALIDTRVTFVPFHEFESSLQKARAISPDPDDTMYFALALRHECAIWSNDKALKKQREVGVFSTREILLRIER